jgi:hypothetical protein
VESPVKKRVAVVGPGGFESIGLATTPTITTEISPGTWPVVDIIPGSAITIRTGTTIFAAVENNQILFFYFR